MKMEYDGACDQKTFQPGTMDSHYSQAPQRTNYGYADDSSRKLRKQWFQENDLDYYNSRNPSLDRQDSFESNYSNQDYITSSKGESNYFSQEEGKERNDIDEQNSNANNSDIRTSENQEKPYWLQDDDSFKTSSDAAPGKNDSYKHNPDRSNHGRQQHPPSAERDSQVREQSIDPSMNSVNPRLHRRFSSNPALNLKTPFANDYIQEGAVMSENASAYSGSRAPKSSSSFQSMDGASVRSNRLRSHRPQPSEMSKLLSFGYCRKPGESGDGFGREQPSPGEPLALRPQCTWGSGDGQPGENDLAGRGKQMAYKPTCIERAESANQSQQEDCRPDMFRTCNARERSSSFGKKKLSFDAGRPDFFNISNGSDIISLNRGAEPAGRNPLDEGLFKMLSKDTRTNFRRRKMDINAPVPPGPLRPPMRR